MSSHSKLSEHTIDTILERATTIVERDKFSEDGEYVTQALLEIERDRLKTLEFERFSIVDNAIVITLDEAEEVLDGMFCSNNPTRTWFEKLLASAKGYKR